MEITRNSHGIYMEFAWTSHKNHGKGYENRTKITKVMKKHRNYAENTEIAPKSHGIR